MNLVKAGRVLSLTLVALVSGCAIEGSESSVESVEGDEVNAQGDASLLDGTEDTEALQKEPDISSPLDVQCEPCAEGQAYHERLDSRCPGDVAYTCKTIDCNTTSFGACGIQGWNASCPPGWAISGYAYYSSICEAYTCTKKPFPTGTYSECDASTCDVGYYVSGYVPGAGSCNGNEKVFCTAL